MYMYVSTGILFDMTCNYMFIISINFYITFAIAIGIQEDLWHVVITSLSCVRLAQKSVISADGFRTPTSKVIGGGQWMGSTQRQWNNVSTVYTRI